jgi:hypothetical protein
MRRIPTAADVLAGKSTAKARHGFPGVWTPQSSPARLGAALLHELRDVGLALEERVKRLLAGPLVDHDDLAVTGGEPVPESPGLLRSVRSATTGG